MVPPAKRPFSLRIRLALPRASEFTDVPFTHVDDGLLKGLKIKALFAALLFVQMNIAAFSAWTFNGAREWHVHDLLPRCAGFPLKWGFPKAASV